MILTRKGDYGLRSILYLAKQPPGKVSPIKEISDAMEIPTVFLAKVMKQFVKRGLVLSKRGVTGGYMLAKPSSAINLKEIIETLEGPIAINKCLKKKDPCHRRNECDAAPVWDLIQRNFISDLDQYTIRKILDVQ
jgi:Rrf2 family protein